MNKIETTADLKQAILQLECTRVSDLALLKKEFSSAYEALRPINIIKSKFNELILAPSKRNLVDSVIGLASGFAVKKLFVGRSPGLFRKLAGLVLEAVVANKVTKNADEIKAIGNLLLKKIADHPADPEKH